MIGISQEITFNASNTLSKSDQLASEILAVPTPSVNYASTISNEINATIIPEEDIEQIISNANSSLSEANDALYLAQNTRYINILKVNNNISFVV